VEWNLSYNFFFFFYTFHEKLDVSWFCLLILFQNLTLPLEILIEYWQTWNNGPLWLLSNFKIVKINETATHERLNVVFNVIIKTTNSWKDREPAQMKSSVSVTHRIPSSQNKVPHHNHYLLDFRFAHHDVFTNTNVILFIISVLVKTTQ
jgi:hypothetical protein